MPLPVVAVEGAAVLSVVDDGGGRAEALPAAFCFRNSSSCSNRVVSKR